MYESFDLDYSEISTGICAGQTSIREFLIAEHGFRAVSLQKDAVSVSNGIRESGSEVVPQDHREHVFLDVDTLLDFVTKQWRARWVITDISDESALDALLRRPFFILVSVDAPISKRYQRYISR